MKPTRTDNNKPSQSTPIRKGKISPDEITRVAEELTRLQVVEAPKIKPVERGNYEIYSEYVKAHCKVHDTYETTGDELKKMFPQRHYGGQIAMHLKRYYGLSYRRVENGRNDTYVFFVEPTREELIIQLTSAESKVIELQKSFDNLYDSSISAYNSQEEKIKELSNEYQETYNRWGRCLDEMDEEINKLKSDLSNFQKTNKILFAFAIGAVITIIIKSVA